MKNQELQYEFKKQCIGMGVEVKLPSMRKAKQFSIYNTTAEETHVYLQADTCCCKINKATGETVYSNKGSMPMDYYLTFKPTKQFTLPMQFVNDILEVLKQDTRYQEDGSIVVDFTAV